MEKVKGLLKPRPTPQQQLREWQRRLRNECRGLDRQIRGSSPRALPPILPFSFPRAPQGGSRLGLLVASTWSGIVKGIRVGAALLIDQVGRFLVPWICLSSHTAIVGGWTRPLTLIHSIVVLLVQSFRVISYFGRHFFLTSLRFNSRRCAEGGEERRESHQGGCKTQRHGIRKGVTGLILSCRIALVFVSSLVGCNLVIGNLREAQIQGEHWISLK
jgi:hypothetical protein